jgi:long-chain fatty acid transport protein
MNMLKKPIVNVLSLAVMSILATNANAGGFALYTESSVPALGNYAAGAAAEAADATTGWYNPAGLALIHSTQAVVGGIGVFPSTKLSGMSTYSTPPAPNYVQTFTNVDGSKDGFVPSFHAALPIGDRATLGLSIVSPFGLATQWDQTSPVRYEATFTEIITMNISPELGARLTDNFAIGGGIDLQYARVKFNRMIGSPALLSALGANPASMDSLSYNKGHSNGVGFHAGVMGMFNDNHTRIGLNYQSEVEHEFNGYSQLQGPFAFPGLNIRDSVSRAAAINADAKFRYDGLVSNSIDLPQVITLSAYHDINEKFALLGSVVWTGWHSFKDIELNGIAAAAPVPISRANITIAQVVVNSTASENYKDAWRAALGANYRYNEKLMLRVGGGYDETPTNNVDRDVRLPDANRWALSVGARYQVRPNIAVDFGYTHLFNADTATVDKTDLIGASSYRVTANGKPFADLVGLGAVWTLDQPTPVAPMK